MNKLHTTAWSDVRQSYITTHEKASAHGKPSSTSRDLISALAGLLMLIGTGQAVADSCTVSSTTISTAVTDTCDLANESVTVNSNGSISVSGSVDLLYGVNVSLGTTNAITNYGTINVINTGGVENPSSNGISNYATITTLTNSNTIKGSASGGTNSNSGRGLENIGTITTLTNSATITGSASGGTVFNFGYGIQNDGTITTLTNSGTITGSASGNSVSRAHGIQNASGRTITTLTNSGTITGSASGVTDNFGYGIQNSGTITTLTNTGTITGSASGGGGVNFGYGIQNSGTIVNLNNIQGKSSGPLGYSGVLPTNYNVIINSTSDYGQLSVTDTSGTMAFGISQLTGLNVGVAGTKYTDVIAGVAGPRISNEATTLTYTSGGKVATYELIAGTGTNVWDLSILTSDFGASGPTLFDTQSSVRASAQKLRSIFNLATITSNFANMNTYDCNLFDTKGMCISAGGRFTTVDNPDSNTTSAVVVVGYKATPNIRIGGFLDQSVNNSTPSGIRVSNKDPLMGAFVVWNQNADGLGYQVKLANAYQDKDVDITREVIGTSEAGRADTGLKTKSYVGELSYGFNYNDKTLLRPYLALRHTTIKQDAYTESGVTTPLSYASLEDRSTTALFGLKLNHQLTPKTTLTASLGIEQDLEHSVDDYTATSTGISGLTSENFNDNIKRTRPVASAGAYYAVNRTQRIAGDIYYQQLPFQSTGSTTAYFNYTLGF